MCIRHAATTIVGPVLWLLYTAGCACMFNYCCTALLYRLLCHTGQFGVPLIVCLRKVGLLQPSTFLGGIFWTARVMPKSQNLRNDGHSKGATLRHSIHYQDKTKKSQQLMQCMKHEDPIPVSSGMQLHNAHRIRRQLTKLRQVNWLIIWHWQATANW